jgi:hypothetical protein
MKVLLTGATGLVGRAVLQRLRQQGDEVLAISRRPPGGPREDKLEWLQADLTTPGRWQEELAARPQEAVVHLAGEPLDAHRWSPAEKARLIASRVASTRGIVEATAGSGSPPRVLVCASGVDIYGPRGDEPLDERSPPGSGFLAELCQRWEEEAARATQSGVRAVSLRFGVVLSAQGGALLPMVRAFKLFVGGPIGDPRAWFPWIHQADVAGLILHALTGTLAGPVNAVAPEQVRMRDFARALGRTLRRPALLPVPRWGLRLLLGELADAVSASKRVVPAAALAAGYRYAHPALEEALGALLRDPPA